MNFVKTYAGIKVWRLGLVKFLGFIAYQPLRVAIDQMGRVLANGPGDRGLIPGQVITKTQKMVLDATLVRIKGEVEQSREGSSAIPYTSV